MNYKLINKYLKNIDLLRRRQGALLIDTITISEHTNPPTQGQEGEFHEIYDIGLEDNMLLKVIIMSDSYGFQETVKGVTFVKAISKTVQIYTYD